MKLKVFFSVLFFCFISVSYAQMPTESFWSVRDDNITSPQLILNLEMGSAFSESPFFREEDFSNGLSPQDYIFSLDANPTANVALQGILASDLGLQQRNLLGLYNESDFSNRKILMDQILQYNEGDVSIGLHYLDAPEDMVFSSNIRQQLMNRYGVRNLQDIEDWQQTEYFANFGQADADHLFLSRMSGERQDRAISGHNIDLSYNLFSEVPVSFINSYRDDGREISSTDTLGFNGTWDNLSVEFLRSENSVFNISSDRVAFSEDIDRLVLAGNFDFGRLQYIDTAQTSINKEKEVFDAQSGWDANFNFNNFAFAYTDTTTEHRDERKYTFVDSNILSLAYLTDNLDLSYSDRDIISTENNNTTHEDLTTLSMRLDYLNTDRYALGFSTREGSITRDDHPIIIQDENYEFIYLINPGQKLTFNYLDAYYENKWSLNLSPIMSYWPIGISYVDRQSDSMGDMSQLALTFPQYDFGGLALDGLYNLRSLFTTQRQDIENIQINTSLGDVSFAAQTQRNDIEEAKNLDSLSVLWRGDIANVDWLYNNRREQSSEDWSLSINRNFGDNITTDYRMQVDDRREFQGHAFALGWNMDFLNLGVNLDLRSNDMNSERYTINSQLSESSDLSFDYFLNPINKKGLIQEGETYRLVANYDFSNNFGIQYLRSNMSFDNEGLLLPTEEESLRLLLNWSRLRLETAYIEAIDKSHIDRSRMEFIILGDLGDWGVLNFKFLDHRYQEDIFDISLEHIGNDNTFSLHCVSDPPNITEVDIGSEYKTLQYYLEYNAEF